MFDKLKPAQPETRSSLFLSSRAHLVASQALSGSLANLASPSPMPSEQGRTPETSDQIKAAIFDHIDQLNRSTKA